ncbi:hypothetical protein I4U23_022685 [Adineta vaga]|nr:hypothetical protein I4U23_022685 [Adineta vaga]
MHYFSLQSLYVIVNSSDHLKGIPTSSSNIQIDPTTTNILPIVESAHKWFQKDLPSSTDLKQWSADMLDRELHHLSHWSSLDAQGWRDFVNKTIAKLDPPMSRTKNFTFFELGVGVGAVSRQILLNYPHSNGIGVDVVHDTVELARSILPSDRMKLYTVSSIQYSMINDNTIDHIIGPGVICYFPSLMLIADLFKELSRIAKPNASMSFTMIPYDEDGKSSCELVIPTSFWYENSISNLGLREPFFLLSYHAISNNFETLPLDSSNHSKETPTSSSNSQTGSTTTNILPIVESAHKWFQKDLPSSTDLKQWTADMLDRELHHLSHWASFDAQGWRDFVNKTIAKLDPPMSQTKNFTFFELGVGVGAVSRQILLNYPHSNGIGVDVVHDTVELARSILPSDRMKLYTVSSIQYSMINDNTIDHIIGSGVICYFPSLMLIADLFKELSRIAKPNASMCFTVIPYDEDGKSSCELVIPTSFWFENSISNLGLRVTNLQNMSDWNLSHSHHRYFVNLRKEKSG